MHGSWCSLEKEVLLCMALQANTLPFSGDVRMASLIFLYIYIHWGRVAKLVILAELESTRSLPFQGSGIVKFTHIKFLLNCKGFFQVKKHPLPPPPGMRRAGDGLLR